MTINFKMLAAATVLGVAAITVSIPLLKKASTGDVGRFVSRETEIQNVLQISAKGCIDKASSNPAVLMMLIASGGKACLNLVANDINLIMEGKGLCSKTDSKCLYTVGYVAMSLALSKLPSTDEEIAALQSEVDTEFEKSLPMKE